MSMQPRTYGIADGLSAEIVDTQKLDTKQDRLVESALILGCSYVSARWRSDRGNPVAVNDLENDQKQVIYDGNLEIAVHSVFDMTYDYTTQNWEDLDWVEVRVKRNRWDLAAQFPELATDIKKLPGIQHDVRSGSDNGRVSDDMVYVYEMYHKPTPSLPRGRMLIYSCKKTIYYDDVNIYGVIPIEQYKPEPIEEMSFGYPMLSNLLPAQEMLDHAWSCIATNQSSLGVQNISVPRNSDINVQQLYGMNFFEYTLQSATGGGKPEKLDLLSSAPELFKFPELMLTNMQQMSFINAAVRGELPAGTSGVAIATLTTNALEFLNSYSKSLQSVLEKTMYHSINAYMRFAKTERIVSITGKNFQTFNKPFTGDVLKPIKGIKMDSINPLMQTIAGRIDIAEKTIQQGLVKDIQGYVSILDGQPLNKLYETELSESDLIASENDRMEQGEQVMALSVDNHALHIMRHKTLLNDPKIRMDSPRAAQIQEHIEQHLMLQRSTDPVLMIMANTGRAPDPMAMGAGAPMEGPPPQEQQPMATEGESVPVSEGIAGGAEPELAKPATGEAPDLLGRA